MLNKTRFPSHLNVAITSGYKIPPNEIFDEIRNGTTAYMADAPVLRLLSEHFGFTFHLHSVKGSTLGYPLPNGTWTGNFGMVQQGFCDLAIGALGPTVERSRAVNFIFPYSFTDITFAADMPEYLPKSFAILKPFVWDIWLALAVSFISMSSAFHLLLRRKYGILTVALHFFAILLEKSPNMNSRKTKVRLVWLAWVVGTMFVINGYKAVLLAFMSFPTLSGVMTIKDLSEAARDPSYRCFSYPRSAIFAALVKSTDESLARIAECARRHSPLSFNQNDVLRNSTYKKALILGRTYLAHFKNDFFVSEDSLFVSPVAMAVGKNFCCKQLLEDFVHRGTAAGLFQKFDRDSEFFSQLQTRSLSSDQPEPERQITLDDLAGVFIILSVGLSLSALVFVFEVLVSRKCSRNSNVV